MTTPKPVRSSAGLPIADITSGTASVFVAVTIALVATFAATETTREWLSEPGGLLDWIKGVCFAAALAGGLWAVRRSPSDSWFRWVIPVAAAWGTIDALRYGTPYNGVHPPVVGGVTTASVSDLSTALSSWAADVSLSPLIPAGLLACVLIGAWVARGRLQRWAQGQIIITEYRVVAYLLAVAALTVSVPVIAMFGESHLIAFTSRMVALLAAEILVLAALAAGDHRRTAAGWRGRMRPWIQQRSPLESRRGQ